MKYNARPPRICMLLEQFYPHTGGVEVHTRNLAESLIKNGMAVFVVTRQLTDQLSKQDHVNGVPVYRLPPSGTGQFKKWLLIFSALVFLIKGRNQYDIIYVPFFRILAIPAVIAGKMFQKGCILRAAAHGEFSGEVFDHGLKRWGLTPSSFPVKVLLSIRKWLIEKADWFISISSDITVEYRMGGIDPKKIKYIPHGIATERFHPVSDDEKGWLRRALGLPESRIIVAFVGRLVSSKGLP